MALTAALPQQREALVPHWPDGPAPGVGAGGPALDIVPLGPITPLDAQLGVHPARTCPEALSHWLFAPDGLTTYAILDAARLPGIGGEDSLSPTPCRSLFAGAARAELAAVAPYLVQLAPGDRTLQRLMTRGPLARDWWDARAAIYLRSAAPLGDLHRHLRHYTKVRDPAGAWYFFRFWEPDHIVPLLQAMQDDPADLAGFLHPRDAAPIRQIIAPSPEATVLVSARTTAPATRRAFVMQDRYRAVFEETVTLQVCRDLARHLTAAAPRQSSAFGLPDDTALANAIRQLCRDLRPFGVTRKADIARLAACAQFYGGYLLYDPRLRGPIEAALRSARGVSVRVKLAEDALKGHPLHPKVTTPQGLRDTATALSALADAPQPPDRWLAGILASDWGFDSAATRDAFLGAVREQQVASGAVSHGDARAHLLMARLYGPYWHIDPLQPGLCALWQNRDGRLAAQLGAECERRIGVLTGAAHG